MAGSHEGAESDAQRRALRHQWVNERPTKTPMTPATKLLAPGTKGYHFSHCRHVTQMGLLISMTAKPAKIYKYVSPEHLDNVFHSPDVITLKCSLPKNFNDPYELFLTINFNERPDALAFYADAIGELPQFPTTCFSRSPVVVPMWAHYAQNLQGFVLEFSQDALLETVPESSFGDVNYSDKPREDLSELLYRAYVIGKYRYTYLLQRAVFNAAYLTKLSCWSYEQECRMIVPESDTRQAGSLTLLDAPNECITSIICGPRASEQTKLALINKAEEIVCRYFDFRVGRSSATPYFTNEDGEPFSFDVADIARSHQYCENCKEPLATEAEQCSWCQIDDELRQQAASRNPFRLLDRAGLLESYVAGMDEISAKHRKSKT
jgi:Protein of unknown function (DUF2971)